MSPEIQPRFAETPSCTDLTIGLCFPSLCQLPPTFSSLHTLLPSLEPQPPLHRSPANIPALSASLLPDRRQHWATHLPAFSVPPHGQELAVRGPHTAAGLEPQSHSLNLGQALVSHLGNSHMWPYSSFFLLIDDEHFGLSPQASNKLESLPHEK